VTFVDENVHNCYTIKRTLYDQAWLKYIGK